MVLRILCILKQSDEWKNMLAKLTQDLDGKLDRLELNPLKEWLEKKLKALSKKIQEGSLRWSDDEAAGLKRCVGGCRKVVVAGKWGGGGRVVLTHNFKFNMRMSLWWSLCTLYLQVRVILGDSGLCCYICYVFQALINSLVGCEVTSVWAPVLTDKSAKSKTTSDQYLSFVNGLTLACSNLQLVWTVCIWKVWLDVGMESLYSDQH